LRSTTDLTVILAEMPGESERSYPAEQPTSVIR
jgi:hypothetical protein